MKRKLLAALLAALSAWVLYGAEVRAGRPARPPPPPGELRGAWHVHTTASDGLGTLDEVVDAVRDAGLQFVVVTDHNVLGPAAPAWRDGVLVIPATEASTRFGHVVAAGVPRALSDEEKRGDPLGAIAALGGQAVLAHPLHPRRPFKGWGTGPWRGFEIVSNDTDWHRTLRERAVGRILRAALVFPWDPPSAVLALSGDPAPELARFDAELRDARAVRPVAAHPPPGPARVLLCSADAHGYPSYRAAFGAFSMHVPVAATGDAAADARAVLAALLDGSAACVHDGEAPASGVALRAPAAGGAAEALVLELRSPDLAGAGAEAVLLRDGAPVARATPPPDGAPLSLPCGGRCAPGDYRVEVRRDGRPWIFTNPVAIE